MSRSSRPRAPKGAAKLMERVTVLLDPEYKAETLPEIMKHFGMNASDLGKFAIEELWRRRNEPTVDQVSRLATYGVSDVIPDFDTHQFSKHFRLQGNLTIQVDDLSKFLAFSDHRASLAARISTGLNTRIYLPIKRLGDGSISMDRSNADALTFLVKAIPLHVRTRFNVNGDVTIPNFTVYGLPDLRERFVISSQEAIVAPTYKLAPQSPCMVYISGINSVEPLTKTELNDKNSMSGMMHIRTPNVGFYNHYAIRSSDLVLLSEQVNDILKEWLLRNMHLFSA